MSRTQIASEMARVEALIESPEGKGKVSALKAYHRKLYAMYCKAA